MSRRMRQMTFGVLLTLVLAPFAILAFFTHPQLDDYVFASKVLDYGYWGAQLHWYENFSGRFTASLLLSLHPLVIEWFNLYHFYFFVLLGCLVLSTNFLLRSLGGLSENRAFMVSLSFFALFLTGMPTVSEGLYWPPGVITYTLSYCFLSLLIGHLVQYLSSTGTTRNAVWACIFAFLTPGMNEPMAILVGLLLLLFIFDFKKIPLQKRKVTALISLHAMVGISLVVFCPGNEIRASYSELSHDFLYSLKWSFVQTIKYFVQWIGNPVLLILSFLFIPLGEGIVNRKPKWLSRLSRFHLATLPGGAVAVFYILNFVGYWNLGYRLPPRAVVPIYLVFLTLWFVYILILLNRRKIRSFKLTRTWQWIGAIAIFFSVLSASNLKRAYRDLLYGEALTYNRELNERYSLIRGSEPETEVVLKPLSVKPKSLHIYDIKTDPTHYMNTFASGYWRRTLKIRLD